jgi:NitT/TauT family transport system substrate-binding protein
MTRAFPLLLLTLLLALAGCEPAPEEVRIGSNRWLGYGPLYLADELGWTGPSRIRLVEYPNTTGVIRGFRNGMLDGAMLTLDELLVLQSQNAEMDLEILLVTNVSAGADVLYARPPIGMLSELKGHRIGVENTALGAFFLSRILDSAGLTIADIEVANLQVHEHLQAFRSGQIDAVVSFASEGPALEKLGARRVFDSRLLPDEIVDVLVVDRRRVNAQERKRLAALWYDALRAWQENPAQTNPRLERRLGLTPEALQMTLGGLVLGDPALNRQWHEQGRLRSGVTRLASYLSGRQLLGKASRPDELFAECQGGRHPC